MKTILVVALMAMGLAVRAASPDVFLLMGQSNMAGYGALLPEDKRPHEGQWVLRGTPEKDARWEAAAHPFHTRCPASDRYGLAGAFGLLYRETWPTREVGFVPLGWGGAALARMDQASPYYKEVLAKARWAKANGTLKGLLWHQGCSDTVHSKDAETYAERLKAFFEGLRKDLEMPELPIVIGDLPAFYGTLYPPHAAPDRQARIRTVRAALRRVAREVPHATFVPSANLRSHDGYNVHFDRASDVILGARYFDAYWRLITPTTPDLAE